MSEQDILLTSALFGNVDESGNLDEDFLDEETKCHLSSLGSFFNSQDTLENVNLDKNYAGNSESDGENSESCSGTISKAASALDFADIDETIDEGLSCKASDDLSSNGDSDNLPGFQADNSDDESEPEDQECPMAGILPDIYKYTDVKTFFPAFRKNKVLRFSRLFRPRKQHGVTKFGIWKSVSNKTKQKNENSAEKTTLQYESDDEVKFLRPGLPLQKINKSNKGDLDDGKIPGWRYGAAAYWYDKMGIAPSGHNLNNYGMKVDDKPGPSNLLPNENEASISKELFLPLNLSKWEEKVIMTSDEVREEVSNMLTSGKQPLCGWIPTQQTRTYDSFMAMFRSGGFGHVYGKPASQINTTPCRGPTTSSDPNSSNFCIFPPDNLDLMFGDWEKDVIISTEKMQRIPEPKIPTVDLCDDPLLYGIPEDLPKEDANNIALNTTITPSANTSIDELNSSKTIDRKEHVFTRKSQVILGKVAQRQREEEEEAANVHMVEKDDFNLSNDDYYQPKGTTSSSKFSGSMIQHSIPAQNLMQPFFFTYWSVFKLRHFHRLPLKRYNVQKSVLGRPTFHTVRSLQRVIQSTATARELERVASGGGEMFFMRRPEDLSGKDGTLIFCEYSEEHPSLIMQPGMATKIKNFYKRKTGKENIEPKFEFGETSYTHTTPFLGTLSAGETLQALENNLFRAPIYRHQLPWSDFLVIRDRQGYYIREVPSIFAVGQECPLYEVPGPNSKRASNFVRDYLMVFIYRLFWQSSDSPKRLKMEDVRRAFPHYAESTIRKRLKICSDFKRLAAGPESNYWVLRPDFRLPNLEEIRAIVTPEMCCAAFSMHAHEQLLKDAGYGERYFFAAEDEEEESDQTKMADEIRCAPWNTTRAYISAMNGKCVLDLTGVADPTGCGEGFSYVRLTAKPPKEELPTQAKRTVTGTDADLRKLSLKDAKMLLKEFGVKEDEIKTLTRWEIIDVIRTLSTQQAKAGGTGITKFARGNVRYSIAEVHEKYKQDCQRIFDLQNRVLASAEHLSTDDEQSEGADSDLEEMGKNIETMLSSKKAMSRAMRVSNEEQLEREELKKLLLGDTIIKKDAALGVALDSAKSLGQSETSLSVEEYIAGVCGQPSAFAAALEHERRKLKIYRKRVDDNGREYVNVEVVTKPQLIEAYLKIRTSKDDAFIKSFAQMDEQYKEEKRREKRRLQDQLRRIRRNETRIQQGLPLGRPPKANKPTKPPPPPKPSLLKMKCSACGASGHMKTNKNCPLYHKWRAGLHPEDTAEPVPGIQVAPTDEQIAHELDELATMDNLTSIEGTKIKLSRAVLERTEKMKRKALKLKFPKHIVHSAANMASLVPQGPGRGRKKRKIETTDGQQGESAVTRPVPKEKHTIPASVTEKLISKLILKTTQATNLSAKKLQQPGPSRDALPSSSSMALSKHASTIQRRRADPKVSMSLVLEQILNQLRAAECSRQFLSSVNKKQVIDYYKIVKRPMDLSTIKMNLTKNQYLTREEFLKDVQQIFDNSRLYNGDHHAITQSARELFELASKLVTEREQKLMKLEKLINPLLDDNDLVAFCFILDRIIQECKKVPKSFIFHHPVDKKKYVLYYDKILHPMDLGSMELKCKRHQYETVNGFTRDVELVFKNCETFNGPASSFTSKAREIMDIAHKMIGQNAQHLADLEKRIQTSKQKLLDDMETESFTTGVSSFAGERQADEVSFSASGIVTPSFPLSPASPGEEGEETVLQNDLLMSDIEDDDEDQDEKPPATPRIQGDEGSMGSMGDQGSYSAMDFSMLSNDFDTSTIDRPAASPQGVSDEVEALSRCGTPRLAEDEEDSRARSAWDDAATAEDVDAENALVERLERSSMAQAGRLHSDLAMSSEDEENSSARETGTARNRDGNVDFDF